MSEVKRYYIGAYSGEAEARTCSPNELEIIHQDEGRYFVLDEDFNRITAERDAALTDLASANSDKEAYAQNAIDLRKRVDALQALLTAADERAVVLEGLLANAYETAAKWVEKRMDDYVNEHGSEDPETGSLELPGTGDEYVCELMEIADGLRALKPAEGADHE